MRNLLLLLAFSASLASAACAADTGSGTPAFWDTLRTPVAALDRAIREHPAPFRPQPGYRSGLLEGRSASGPVWLQIDRVAAGDYWYYRLTVSRGRDWTTRTPDNTLRFDYGSVSQATARPAQLLLAEEYARGESARWDLSLDASGRITRVTARFERRRLLGADTVHEISANFQN